MPCFALRLIAAAAALLLIFGCSQPPPQDNWKVKVGDALPTFSLKSTDGQTVSSEDLKGKVAVIALFATWCPPCRMELPVLSEQIYTPLKDKGLVVLAVDFEEPADDVKKFAQTAKLSFPLLIDEEGKFASSVGGEFLPRSLIVDRSGKIHALHTGFDPAHPDELRNEVEALLSEK